MTSYPRAQLNTGAYLKLTRAACFICELLAGNPEYPHHVAYRSEDVVVFMAKFPRLVGSLLVAPVQHREQVVGDFEVDEYLALQRVVHAAGAALAEVVSVERLYVLSLGSQQANRHVHWHVAPLPPGVPYEQQEYAALSGDSYVQVPDEVMAEMAVALSTKIAQLLR